jgi:hypothetical protein
MHITITSSSPLIHINTSSTHTPYISPGAQSSGMLRYNTNTHHTEVYDGNSWQQLSKPMTTVSVDETLEIAVRWVMEQMHKEAEIKAMAKTHASIQYAVDNVDQAKKELELIYQLTKEHSNV